MNEKILCVDDERNVLEAYQRSLRKEFEIEIATGAAEGLEAVANRGPFAVIVSDMRMPHMDGIRFLARVKEVSPDSVRIMLTGNADQQTAIQAVNEGSIFRFLNKPCSPQNLAVALNAAIHQYRLTVAEKELLEKTLIGCVQVLTEILSMVNPTAFGRASRVRRMVSQLAEVLKIRDTWQVEVAAMLSQVGCISIPEEILNRLYYGHVLDNDELKMIQAHPQIGYDLLKHIPRLEGVAEIVAYQEKLFNGQGLPNDHRRGAELPIGARILKVALDFDKMLQGRRNASEVLETIQKRSGLYDPAVVDALRSILSTENLYEMKYVRINDLSPNMLLAEDIFSVKGVLLIPNGQPINPSLCLRLKNFRDSGAINEPIKVLQSIQQFTSAAQDVWEGGTVASREGR
ncbi:MAG TPA: HD domain-containing phosphohydrolase [Blastocatellia bacterium]|nr:HD domain-containing phosphohydrolase [Blastocatellia bacterium]